MLIIAIIVAARIVDFIDFICSDSIMHRTPLYMGKHLQLALAEAASIEQMPFWHDAFVHAPFRSNS
jgi:hypothetical protein